MLRQSPFSVTTSAFQLKGGKYAISVLATFGGGSVKFQILGPDGSTFISVSNATDFTAAGYATVFTLTNSTGVNSVSVSPPGTGPS